MFSHYRTAAAAAIDRIQQKQPSKDFNTSLAAIKAQVRRELEAEKKLEVKFAKSVSTSDSTNNSTSSSAGGATSSTANESVNKNLACQGVFFKCPLISSESLPRKEWKIKIKEFLYQQLEEERGLTACLIIQNCNPPIKVCIYLL